MRLICTTTGLLAAAAILSGCASFFGLRDFSAVSRANNVRIMTLQLGMTPEQVSEHMGPSYDDHLSNPVRIEMYTAADDTFRAFFFYIAPHFGPVSGITDRDLMPVVFKNEILDGWGWLYWQSMAEQYNLTQALENFQEIFDHIPNRNPLNRTPNRNPHP